MTIGLITRDSSGVITADMTKNLSQMIGHVISNRANGTVTFTIPPGKIPISIVSPLEPCMNTAGKLPGVIMTSTSMSWTYNIRSGFPMNCIIYYGYY